MIIDDYIPAAELTGYVRELPAPANLILERFLPDQSIENIKAALDMTQQTNRAAKFRSWDAPVSVGKRDVFESREVKLPPLGQKLVVGEYEQLQLQIAQSGGSNKAAMIRAIYNDVDNNIRSIYNRMELARGSVLSTGKFVLDENGLILEADFGVPGDQFVAPAGPTWDNHDTATPLSDMRPWMLQYARRTGSRPAYALMSEETIGHLAMNKEVREQLGGNVLRPFATDDELASIMRTNRFPAIVPYDTVIDVDGAATRAIEEGKVVFLPQDPTALGQTLWGITAEALALVNSNNPQLTFEQAPGLVGVVTREGDPPRVWSKAGAVSMPVIRDTRQLMVATVHPPTP